MLKNNPSINALELSVKDVKAADAAAKLIKKESAVELDTSNGKVTNLSAEEVGDIFLASVTRGEVGKYKVVEVNKNEKDK